MIRIRHVRTALLVIGAFIGMACMPGTASADPLFDDTVTFPNVAGLNDQTGSSSTSTENVVEVKASRILQVNSIPASSTSITLGLCVITFGTTSVGLPAQDLNCLDNAARVNISTTTSDTVKTTAELTTSLAAITGASATGHGSTTFSAGTTTTKFVVTTTGTESSATDINFSTTTSSIISVGSTTGVVPVAAIRTLTVTGTVEPGDIFRVLLPSAGQVTYTVQTTDSTTAQIATGINDAIQASGGYGAQAFTSDDSSNTVVMTAKTAGTSFHVTSSTTNTTATAQEVEFTPTSVETDFRFTVTINGTSYEFTSTAATAQNVVEGLAALLAANTDVSCSEDNVTLTCSAVVAGTSFTHSASVSPVSSSGGGGGGGGHSSSGSRARRAAADTDTNTTTPTPTKSTGSNTTPTPTTGTSPSSYVFTGSLAAGTTGDAVTELQKRLAAEGVYTGPITGFFGPLTEAGVKAFQAKYGIDQLGIVGPMTMAKLNGGAPAASPVPGTTPAATTPATTGFMFMIPLAPGATSEDVTELQKRLAAEGVYTGPITGFFGPLTEAGVKAFQAKYGIDQLGIVGPATRAKLNGAAAPATSPAPTTTGTSTADDEDTEDSSLPSAPAAPGSN